MRPVSHGFKMLVVALLCLLPGRPSLLAEKRDSGVPVTGKYVNAKYGYSVRVPEGLQGFRPSSPAPQHGFGLFLNQNTSDSIWVNGEFDAAGLGSAKDLADREAARLCREYGLTIAKIAPAQLSGLESRDVVLENSAATGSAKYVHFVVAFRAVPHETGIAYVIGLRQKTRSAAAARAFSAIVRSFETAEFRD
jgi:hypothetical protein